MTKIGPAAARKNRSGRRDYACKTAENRYIGGQGVPAQCVGAPLRASRKTWRLGPYSFWTSCGIHLKGAGAKRGISFGRQGLPAVSGSPSCPRLQVPAAGLNTIACTDGEDRFGAERPATGSNLENPVRLLPAPGGQDLSSAILPAFVQRKVRMAGRNRRCPGVNTGRQPERACSGSSG